MDAMVAAGWMNQLTVENKDVALWQIVVHESLLKRKTPLDQFIDGLKSVKSPSTTTDAPRANEALLHTCRVNP